MPETKPLDTTPPAAEFVFAAMYHLAGIPYIDGVTFEDDLRGKERVLAALARTKLYCDKAIHALSENE